MADDTRTANVELTADVSGYTQGMSEAYSQTNNMIGAVNKLSTSLEGLTKKIGKKLLIFSAADTAVVVGMVAIAAKYEKQLSTLAAQQAIAGKQIKIYKEGITDLSKELPKTRGELVQLVTQIEHLGITSERESLKMSRVFTNLAAATGEDVSGLTQGMIELGRAMGTLGGGAGQMEKFTDSLVTVAAESGVAAQSVVNFANSISPFARSAGIGEAALLGISAAFTKAGADGYAAANTFNSIISDITRQTYNGSPEIAKYANALGLTVDQFKNMSALDQVVGIFEAVNKAGAGGIRIMDMLGQDGIRAARVIQQVSNQAGGLRKAVQTSLEAYGGGKTQKGATEAFDTLDSKMVTLRNQMEIFGSAIGEGVLPFAKELLDVFNNMIGRVTAFAEPLLKVAGVIAATLAPVTAAAGVLMNLMGPLSTLLMAFMAMRFTPLRAAMEGIKEGVMFKQGALPSGGATVFGQKMAAWNAEKESAAAVGRPVDRTLQPRWYQQAGYQMGRLFGETKTATAISRVGPPGLVGVGTNLARLVGAVAGGTREWYQDAPKTGAAMYGKRSMAGMLQGPINQAGQGFGAIRSAWSGRDTSEGLTSSLKSFKTNLDASGGALNAFRTQTTAASSAAAGSTASSTAASTVAKEEAITRSQYIKQYIAASGTLEAFQASLRKATGQLLMVPASAARFGARAVGQIGSSAMNMFGMLGGMVGGGAGTGMVLAALGGTAYLAKNASEKTNQALLKEGDLTNLGPTDAALGNATRTLGEMSFAVTEVKREFRTLADAARLTAAEQVKAATDKAKDPRVASIKTEEQALAFLNAMGKMSPEQLNSLTKDLGGQIGFGSAQTVAEKYIRGLDPKTGLPSKDFYGQTAVPLLESAAGEVNDGWWGAIRNAGTWIKNGGETNPLLKILSMSGFPKDMQFFGQFNKSDEAIEMIKAAEAAIPERAAALSGIYGNDKVGTYSSQIDQYQLLMAGFNMPLGAARKTALDTMIQQMEDSNMGGKELGITINEEGAVSSGGVDIRGPLDFYKYLTDENSGVDMSSTDAAKRFRAAMKSSDLTPEDYLGGEAFGIQKKYDAATKQTANPVEQAIAGTALGYTAKMPYVYDVTTNPGALEDQEKQRKAIDTMTDAALKQRNAADGVTASFNDVINAAGGVTSVYGQIAVKAKSEAQQMELLASKSGGWTKEFQTRWNQLSEDLFNPRTDDNRAGEIKIERAQMKADLLEQLRGVWLQQKQFALSQERAAEDFKKSTARAIEDAASGWQSAFERGANQQQMTNSPSLIQFNQQEQLSTVKGQLSGLRTLRGMGLSKQAIADMGLADANMGNQTIRLAQTASKEWVQVQNELASERKKVVGELTKEFSRPFERASDDYKKATDRAIENMQLMGQAATKTMEELIKDSVKLATVGGYSSMFILSQIRSVWDSLPEIDDSNKNSERNKAREERDQEAIRAQNRADAERGTLPTGGGKRPIGVASGSGVGKTRDRTTPEEFLRAWNDFWNPDETTTLTTRDDSRGARVGAYSMPSTVKGGGSTSMDYSNNYSIGTLKVEAQDPEEMQRKLAAKTRRSNLRGGHGQQMK